MSIALLMALLTKAVFWLPLWAFISFIFFFYHNFSNKNLLSYANQVTAFRFLLSSITALSLAYLSNLVIFCLFGLTILLDGLDGYLARKYQQESSLGALFDKTTDAYFVLVLSFLLIQNYPIPFWFIGIGYLHYGYELLMTGLDWHTLSIPKNPVGKYVAALLFISLLSPFLLKVDWYLPIIYIATISTLISFSFSLWLKYKAASVRQ